jgi:hypothetical protein
LLLLLFYTFQTQIVKEQVKEMKKEKKSNFTQKRESLYQSEKKEEEVDH